MKRLRDGEMVIPLKKCISEGLGRLGFILKRHKML